MVRASYTGRGDGGHDPDIIKSVKSAQYFFRLVAILLATFGAGVFVWTFGHREAPSEVRAAVKDETENGSAVIVP